MIPAPVKAGETVEYVVTFLEMTARPAYDWPSQPAGVNGALLRAENPPAWYLRALYGAVGRDYAWSDLNGYPDAEVEGWIQKPDAALYSLIAQGWPQGFFLLDWHAQGECELCYFGLVPEAVGKGLGTWLLRTAILTAWAREGMEKLTVNTCTLDHPRALAQYQRAGFAPVGQETRTRVLVRDWAPAQI